MTNPINFSEFIALSFSEKGDLFIGNDSIYDKWMTNFSGCDFKYGLSDFYKFDKYILKNYEILLNPQ